MKTQDLEFRLVSRIENGLETEQAIELVKSIFSAKLAEELNLYKVVAPIAVEENTGVNDDLNGVERAVSFPILGIQGSKGVVVQSLAKWKRLRLMQLGIIPGKGILTDMKALRPDENLSQIHSIFVDQWDWEKVIHQNDRIVEYLKQTVKRIYATLIHTQQVLHLKYPQLEPILPPEIVFIHAQDLLNMYPNLSPKEREDKVTREHGAVFIIGIGAELSNGLPHDGRAPDYDDWITLSPDGKKGLNGDIIVWNPITHSALEISSMGIRVDKVALMQQLDICDCSNRSGLMFHKMLLEGKLPLSIGGGIGQSRVCMFLLRKTHIGEVQVGIWPNHTRLAYQAEGVELM